jgi:hypothetical protein
LVSGLSPVRVQNKGRQIDVRFFAEPARIIGGHRGLHECDKFAAGSIAPLAYEIGPGQLRCFITAAQVCHVAYGAVGLIDRAPGGRLLRGIWAWLLSEHACTKSDPEYQ